VGVTRRGPDSGQQAPWLESVGTWGWGRTRMHACLPHSARAALLPATLQQTLPHLHCSPSHLLCPLLLLQEHLLLPGALPQRAVHAAGRGASGAAPHSAPAPQLVRASVGGAAAAGLRQEAASARPGCAVSLNVYVYAPQPAHAAAPPWFASRPAIQPSTAAAFCTALWTQVPLHPRPTRHPPCTHQPHRSPMPMPHLQCRPRNATL
jgi:hypothetical protein